MYYEIVSQCVQSMKNLDIFLDKAQQHATQKKFDVAILMKSSLAPDMKNFIYQVQSACDYAKAAPAWLSGQTPPKHEDNEKTIEEVRARVKKTVDFMQSVKKEQYVGASDRAIKVSWAPGKVFSGQEYLLQVTIPNVYFHISMAYAILRNNGVDVGKMDYLGPLYRS